MAPTGSSTRTLSKKKTLRTTSTPATAPIQNAPHGVTKPLGAVMATRPANRPLHIMPGSGFLVGPNHHMYRVAERVALMPAIIVLVATMPMRLSLAASELPGLNPNQPKARMNEPNMAIGILWGVIGLTSFPFLSHLPRRGPSRKAQMNAKAPPCRWTTPEPA